MPCADPIEDLLAERSLWDLYRASPSVFSTPFNRKCAAAGGLLLLSVSTYTFWWLRLDWTLSQELVDVFYSWAELGLSTSGTIIGFWLAGFSVFFAAIRPSTAQGLIHEKGQDGVTSSELKLILVSFAGIFGHFLLFAAWCAIFLGLWSDPGISRSVAGEHCGVSNTACKAMNQAYIVLFGFWVLTLVLRLKSFGYNLYQSLVIGLADAIDDLEREEKAANETTVP